MIKQDRAIVFIVNKSYLFALATVIENLKQVSSSAYNKMVVYYDDISEQDRENLLKLESRIEFVPYSCSDFVKEHGNIETPLAKGFLNKYSHLAWIKYKIFEQLEFYRSVLFLDLDILINGDLTRIYEIVSAKKEGGGCLEEWRKVP